MIRLHSGQPDIIPAKEATVEAEKVIRVQVQSVRKHFQPVGTLYLVTCKGVDRPRRVYKCHVPGGVRVASAGELLEIKQNRDTGMWQYWS